MTLTPASKGDARQQWICDAIVGDVKPLKSTVTDIEWTSGSVSSTTVAKPVPGEPVGGTSFAPMRLATNVIGVAETEDADSSTAAARTNADDSDFIPHSPEFLVDKTRMCVRMRIRLTP